MYILLGHGAEGASTQTACQPPLQWGPHGLGIVVVRSALPKWACCRGWMTMHAMLVVPGCRERGSLHASAAMPPGSNMHAPCADLVATRAESMSAWLGRPCACLRWMLLISGEGPALGAGGLDPGGAGSEGGSGGRSMCSPSRLHCSASTCEAAQHIWGPLGRHWCCSLGNAIRSMMGALSQAHCRCWRSKA